MLSERVFRPVLGRLPGHPVNRSIPGGCKNSAKSPAPRKFRIQYREFLRLMFLLLKPDLSFFTISCHTYSSQKHTVNLLIHKKSYHIQNLFKGILLRIDEPLTFSSVFCLRQGIYHPSKHFFTGTGLSVTRKTAFRRQILIQWRKAVCLIIFD